MAPARLSHPVSCPSWGHEFGINGRRGMSVPKWADPWDTGLPSPCDGWACRIYFGAGLVPSSAINTWTAAERRCHPTASVVAHRRTSDGSRAQSGVGDSLSRGSASRKRSAVSGRSFANGAGAAACEENENGPNPPFILRVVPGPLLGGAARAGWCGRSGAPRPGCDGGFPTWCCRPRAGSHRRA